MTVVQLVTARNYLTTAQVAAMTGLSKTTLRYYRSVGLGPRWYKPEGRALYDSADVQRWIEESRREPSVRAALEKASACI